MRQLVLGLLAVVAATTLGCQKDTSGLDAIKDRGTLRIAMTGEFPPFNFFNDKNELVGFDVDVAKEISERMELEPDLITLRWDGILAGLAADRYDLIVGSMAITPERQKAVDFSDPYYTSGAQVFTTPGSDVAKNDGDLTGKVVGVNLGTTYEAELNKRSEVKKVRTYNGVTELILDLQGGRIDAFVTDQLVGLAAKNEKGAAFVAAGELLYTETIAVAQSKGQPELLAGVNEALSGMKEDGTYAKVSTKWFGRDIRN